MCKLSIPEIIKNVDNLYEGNLTHYFRVTMNHATNLKNPYHNFRHVFHVMWLCYSACEFYRDVLTPRQMRNLLIAALFHDFNHPGRTGNDDLNIEIAVRALYKYYDVNNKFDVLNLLTISELIRTTEFPHKIKDADLTLLQQILRDADLSQALSIAWIQQIIFGLSSEMNVDPVKVFEMQASFLNNLHFITQWGKRKFPDSEIQAKIKESELYLQIIKST